MKDRTRKVLDTILGERMGFITDEDIATLLADDRTRSRRTLIRAYDERVVVPLHEALDIIDAADKRGTLRDVAFTADECAALRKEVAAYV